MDLSGADGALVVLQGACGDALHQQVWTVTGNSARQQLRVAHTNQCLNVFGGGSDDGGANLIQWP